MVVIIVMIIISFDIIVKVRGNLKNIECLLWVVVDVLYGDIKMIKMGF